MKDSIDNKPTHRSMISIILLTGLLVGTLDILAACSNFMINTGKNPVIVLRYIAGGVFGKKAFSGGTEMALLGLLFHFIIAFSFTIFFFWLYPKLPVLSKSRIITALVYAIFIWIITNLVIVPLSNLPPVTFKTQNVLKAMLILFLMIGLPLSFIAYKYFSPVLNVKKNTGI